ncbi:hypothetical protein H4218_004060 [Coemansia sp. IMI 209128]|nr:hypothetical protein H4218_004060 [Coemansia sp. IMI 209128]
MSDCDSLENKRKRQDSIKGGGILIESPTVDIAKLVSEDEDSAAIALASAESPAGGSSPVKRPRTSEDGHDSPAPNNAEEAKEAAEAVQDKVKGISMEDAPKKLPVFGSAFGVTGFSGFASAAKSASPFAAFTSASSGFAKYAAPVDDAPAEAESEDVAGNEDLDDDAPAPSRRTFEDLLTTKGKETLQDGLASPASTPATPVPATPVRTFEEDETCLFATKAKLFELQSAAWKERGGGQFKVNSKTDMPDKCRLLMRTDLTFRLILNVPLFHGLKAVCERRFVRFTCFDVDSKLPITYALRFATDQLANEAYRSITKNIPDDDNEGHHSASEENDSDDEDQEEEEEEEVEEEEAEEEAEGEAAEDEEDAEEEETAEVAEDEEDAASQSDAESQAEQQSSAAEEEEDEDEAEVEESAEEEEGGSAEQSQAESSDDEKDSDN